MITLLMALAFGQSVEPAPVRPPTGETYRALVRDYGERFLAGEAPRLGRDAPREHEGPVITAFDNTAWARFDRDGSGGLDREEWLDRAWGFQLLYDSDGDGLINEAEYVGGRAVPLDAGNAAYVVAEERRNRGRFRQLGRSRPTFGRGALWLEARHSFGTNDYDHDGEVTPDDVSKLARRWQ